MPYTINKYNGAQITVVADGTIDNTLDIKMIGKNYAGYGEVQNENFLFLLENFSNTAPPPRPLSGQVWYDSANSKLKFYDGSKFRTTGGAETGGVPPTGLSSGDFWFDTANDQLYAWNGSQYVLIGPQGVAGSATTQMRSRSVRDTLGSNHPIIEAISNGITIFIVSSDADFTLDDVTNPITGFAKIHRGVTLTYTNNDDSNNIGQTTSSHRFWGTATDSDRLGGYTAGDFIQSSNASFSSRVSFTDAGFTVGSSNPPKLLVFNESAETPVFRNQDGGTMKFQTTVNSATVTPLRLDGIDVKPGSDNATDLGASTYKFKTIYAYTFDGAATKANTLQVGGNYSSASTESGAGTIVARTTGSEVINGTTITAGAVKGTFFVGTATAANYADLAEKYLPDVEYDVGTVVVIGGEKEITASSYGKRAIGVISENPAYMMNAELEGGVYVALKGRVPVKVSGPVTKGDPLVGASDGTASIVANTGDSRIFAIALESNSSFDVKLVECVIL